MVLSRAPRNLKRYKDIAWLLVKYGRADWARGTGLDRDKVLSRRCDFSSAS